MKSSKHNPEDQENILIQGLQQLASTFDESRAARIAVEVATGLTNGSDCSVWLVGKKDPDQLVCAATYEQAQEEERIIVGEFNYLQGEGLTGWIWKHGKPLRIENIRNRKELKSIASDLKWTDKFGGWKSKKPPDRIRPFLGVPLFSARALDEVIGVIRVGTTLDLMPFTPDDERVLTLFSRVLSLVISNARKIEDEKELLSSLFELGSTLDLNQLLDRGVRRFSKLFKGSHASILLDNGNGEYYIRATSEEKLKARLDRDEPIPATPYKEDQADGKTGWVIKNKMPKRWVNLEGLEPARDSSDCEIPGSATSFIAAPLLDASGRLRGVIRSPRGSEPTFTEEDLELLDFYASQISYLISLIEEHRQALSQELDPYLPIPSLVIQEIFEPEEREITLMYVDLKSFTDFSNAVLKGDATLIIDVINAFAEIAVPLIMQRGGTIDSFQGDGFIALFNGYSDCAKHAEHAAMSAEAIRMSFDDDWNGIKSFRQSVIDLMLKHHIVMEPDDFTLGLKIGFGIARVVIGPVGVQEGKFRRQQFTFIGQDANIISRLISDVPEELKHSIPQPDQERLRKLILCTGRTWDVLKVMCSGLDHIVQIRGAGVRGKSYQRQRIYEILSHNMSN